ncbi:MAG: hypothetical protein JWR85_2792 [Marmoricola sp.]|nr:hypothetical protein [Marmoricola sp.]
MTDIALPTHNPASLRTMAGIEARRLARHPAFIVGVVLAFGVLVLLFVLEDQPNMSDLLSTPVIPAFFIGLPSLVATARLTRSTESTAEAIGTAPGSEARRTAALALACLVPFTAGVVWIAVQLAMVSVDGAHPYEWWFATMPDLQVWTILVALGPVACLGGGLLGVLTGRWLRFPGASAVMVVAIVAIDLVGQMPFAYHATSELRLWVPWAMFHSGSETDGTSILFAGNAAFYLVYLLCLCAAATLVAIWHDRAARTGRLRAAIAGVVIIGLAALTLSMTTGNDHNQPSKPIPFKIGK